MTALQRRLLERLEQVKAGSTICPGQLARDCGTTLAAARADLFALALTRKIVLSQRGETVASGEISGPFRVRLK